MDDLTVMRPVIAAACALMLSGCDGATTLPTDVTGHGQQPGLAYSGTFHPVVHDGEGMAEVYVLDGGALELRFSDDFVTNDGPKLEVWLVRAPDALDSETVVGAEYISLGDLKSPAGRQSYSIPTGTNLSVYQSVVVWCVTFEVNFTTAPLMME